MGAVQIGEGVSLECYGATDGVGRDLNVSEFVEFCGVFCVNIAHQFPYEEVVKYSVRHVATSERGRRSFRSVLYMGKTDLLHSATTCIHRPQLPTFF